VPEQSNPKIRILVAESFELVRMGLRALFKNHSTIRLVAETNCIDDLYHLVALHKPDVILIDLLLDNGFGIDHISRLINASPQSKVLAFSHHNNECTYLQTFRSGAVGIISKHHSSELLLKAIYAIHSGQIWFDRHITKLLWQAQFELNPAQEARSETKVSRDLKLTDSERHIAYLACKGLSAKEISLQLSVTEKTVRNQLSMIYKKTGVKKQIELCLKAPLYNYFKESYMLGISFPEDGAK
jgi:DNA-binding NarL/FixJ family response regulator